ncbi:MAG TPA: hypothetical protein VIM27_12040, partial [Gaiellales bacterium]
FMLTLGRPELAERRPGWGAGKRAFTSMYLEPLPRAAMEALMAGFVPGLGDDLTERILERAEGIPLYAVETVRMLLDRGLLVQDGDSYRPAGPIGSLEIPETLHALIAARLDAAGTDERRVLQDAAVLGKTFTAAALAAITGVTEADLEATLWALVRKEFLQIQTDPLSPERGQYGFLQDLVQRVAYETLSRRDRKARHLAVASYLTSEDGFEEDDIVEVIAAHYLDAFRADPDASDASELRAKARTMLTRAGDRAASLAAGVEAQRYFEQAIDLGDPGPEQASLHERAGRAATVRGAVDEARTHLDAAMSLFEADGDRRSAAQVAARLADVDIIAGRSVDALPRMEAALSVLAGEDGLEEQVGLLAHELGRAQFLTGSVDAAAEPLELALSIAEAFGMPDLLANALQTKAFVLVSKGRPVEARILTEHALALALENDLSIAGLRAYNNLSEVLADQDRFAEALEVNERGLDQARRIGDRRLEEFLTTSHIQRLLILGRWDDATARAAERPATVIRAAVDMVEVEVARGRLTEAQTILDVVAEHIQSDVEWRAFHDYARALLLHAGGQAGEALVAARSAVETRHELGMMSVIKLGLIEAIAAALDCGDVAAADELLGIIEHMRPGELTPFLRAHGLRLRARLDAQRGIDEGVDERFRTGAAELRDLGTPFWLAVTLLEYAEWLSHNGRDQDAAALIPEARTIFDDLRAAPWLARLDALERGEGTYARASARGET